MAWSKQLAFVFVFVVLAGHARPSLAFWPGSTSFHGRPTSGQGTRVLPMVPTSAAKRSVETGLTIRGGGDSQSRRSRLEQSRGQVTMRVSTGTASLSLLKNCVGMSCLTLAGAAAGGNGIGSCLLVIWFMTLLSGRTFELIGTYCDRTGADNLEKLWESCGSKNGWIIDGAMIGYSIMCLSCYVPFLSSVVIPLLSNAGVNQKYLNVVGVKTCVCTFLFLPLSFLRTLKSMTFTSILGNLSAGSTLVVIAIRYFDGSYRPGGQFDGAPGVLPIDVVPRNIWAINDWSGLLSLALRMCFAASAHYVGPKYFSELRDASSERFRKLTWNVYPILGCIYSLFFTLGYLLFGSQTQAALLSNFADNDRLAYLCRWAYAVVSVTMYPLVFASAATAASRGLIRVRQKLQKRAILNERFNYFAVVWAMNILIYAIGTVFTDVGQIADFMGAIFTQLFVFVLPGLLSQTSVGLMELTESSSKLDRLKARANALFIPIGFFFMYTGLARVFSG